MDKKINLELLYKAYNEVRGTREYMKYNMEMWSKVNSKWIFVGHGVPMYNKESKIKKVKNKFYLMVDDEDRYTITQTVSDLLELDLDIKE